ncbi:hypothetical protein VKT23_008708 [Stygiomarasmius scandens]|uniref:Uncharacterized protein n=1 Tax=Marasmiellus scandens TaxID=2682957 RepID=A0ABR1JJR6_9AGAR
MNESANYEVLKSKRREERFTFEDTMGVVTESVVIVVHTRTQGYSNTSESALASAPADRTRSKTQGKPALQSERLDPRINRRKKMIKVLVVEITQTLSRLKAPASSVSRLQVPLSNQVAPVLQPVLDQELEPSASRAPRPKESAKLPGFSVSRLQVHLGNQVAPGQETDTSVPRPNESDNAGARSHCSQYMVFIFAFVSYERSHSVQYTQSSTYSSPSLVLAPFPAALGDHGQLEALEMLDVSYADLDREELEYRKKQSVGKDNEQRRSGEVSSTPQERAVEALREYVVSSMEEDEITDELQALLAEERQQALEEYIPSLLHTQLYNPVPSRSESTPPSTRVQSPTPQEKVVDALRSYVTSAMGVGEITDHLYSLLGIISSEASSHIRYCRACQPDCRRGPGSL